MAIPQNGPDFKVRDNFDPVAAAQLISQKAEREQQMALKASAERRAKLQGLFDAITTGQQIAQNSLKLAEGRLRKEGIGEAVRVLGEKPPTASSSALPEQGEFLVQPSPEHEQSKKDRLAQAMLKIDPNSASSNYWEGQFPNSASGRGTEQMQFLVLDDGTKLPTRFDTTGKGALDLNGVPHPPELLKRVIGRDYAGEFIKDPASGRVGFGSKATGEIRDVAQPGDGAGMSDTPDNALMTLRTKAPKVYEQFSKTREEAFPSNNQALKEQVDAVVAASQIKAILSQKEVSEVGLKSLGFYFARGSGSNSQLSDPEREVFEKPLAFLESLKNTGYRLVAGDLSPTMRKDLLRLSDLMEKKNKLQAKRQLTSIRQKARQEAGGLWSENLAKTIPDIDDLVISASDIGQADIEAFYAEQEGSRDTSIDDQIAATKAKIAELKAKMGKKP